MPSAPTLIEGGAAPERRRGGPEPTLIEVTVSPTSVGGLGVSLAAGGEYLDLQLVSALQVASGEADLWLAKDACGRSVVLKVYRCGVEPKAEVAEKLGRISREHVVEVYRRGVGPDGRHYEVLEHIQHGSLADLGKGGMVAAKVREVLQQLVGAVEALHAENIVHRDLKPSNVLVRALKPLDLALADFGISSVADVPLHVTTLHRTPAYSAPEAMTAVVSKASDWWSVGVMMLELSVGRHPYAGLNELAINFQLATKGIAVPGDLPARWQMLLKGLLTRDYATRWEAGQVRQWLAGQKSIPVHYEGPSAENDHRYRPYKFAGKDYYVAGELAKALAIAWDEAVKHFGRRMITDWVSGQLSDQQLASVLLDIADDPKLNAEQKLAVALVAMDEALPLSWRGEVVSREWLAASASGAFELLDSSVPDWLAQLRKERTLKELRQRRSEANLALKRYGLPVAEAEMANVVFAKDEEVQKLATKVQEEYYSSTNPVLSKLLSKSELEWAEAVVLALAPPSFFTARRKQEAAECFKKFKRDLEAPDSELISDLERHRQQIPETILRFERRLQKVFGKWAVPKQLAERVKTAASKAAEEAEGKIASWIIERVKPDLEVPESEAISDLERHRQQIPDVVLKLEQRLQKVFGTQPAPKHVLDRVKALSSEAEAEVNKAIAARIGELAEQRLREFEGKCVASGQVPTGLQHLAGCRTDIGASAEVTEQGLRELYRGENVPGAMVGRLSRAKQRALGGIDALVAERAAAERDVSEELPRRLAEDLLSDDFATLKIRVAEIKGRFSDIDCSQLERSLAALEVRKYLPLRLAQGQPLADFKAVQTRVEEIKGKFPDIDCSRVERSLAEVELRQYLPLRLAQGPTDTDCNLTPWAGWCSSGEQGPSTTDFKAVQTRVEEIKRKFPDIDCSRVERSLAEVEISRILPPQLARDWQGPTIADFKAVQTRVEAIKRKFPDIDCRRVERSLAEVEISRILPPQVAGDWKAARSRLEQIKREFPGIDCGQLERLLSEREVNEELPLRLDQDSVQAVRTRLEAIKRKFPDIDCSQLERSLAKREVEVELPQKLAKARLAQDFKEVKTRVEWIKSQFGRRVDCSQIERSLTAWITKEIREELPQRVEHDFQEVRVRLAEIKRGFPDIACGELESAIHAWEDFCGGLDVPVMGLEQSLHDIPVSSRGKGLWFWGRFSKQRRAILGAVAQLQADVAGRRAALDQPQYRGTRSYEVAQEALFRVEGRLQDIRKQVAQSSTRTVWGAALAFGASVVILAGILAGIYGYLALLDTGSADEKGLGAYPRTAQGWKLRGDAWQKRGEPQRAIECYEKAVSINVQFPDAWSAMGDTLYSRGEYASAISYYDQALETDPRHTDALCDKGAALQALSRDAEALQCFDKALEVNPKEGNAWNNKAVSLRKLGRDQEALACYDRALEINPRHPSAWSNKGLFLDSLGRREEAMRCYTNALEFCDSTNILETIRKRLAVPQQP